MIAEGVLGYFDDLDGKARDRLLRAFEVGRAAQYSDLARLSASWLAHIDFNRGQYESMAKYAIDASPDLQDRRDSADCRTLVVLGDASLYCGAYQDALSWHESARQIAVEIGDEATLAAIMYNKAAFNCNRVQLNSIVGVYEEEPARFLNMSIDSADYFCQAARHTSLQQLTQVLRARRSMLAGDFHSAVTHYASIIEGGLPTSYVDQNDVLRAELALCLYRTGDSARALALADELVALPSPRLSPDAATILWGCVVRIATDASKADVLSKSSVRFDAALSSYRAEIAQLQSQLEAIKANCFGAAKPGSTSA